MQDVYKNIEEYNPEKNEKNPVIKKIDPIVTELFVDKSKHFQYFTMKINIW